MKNVLIISIIYCLVVTGFVYSKESNNDNNTECKSNTCIVYGYHSAGNCHN